jgi:hypothetical protein
VVADYSRADVEFRHFSAALAPVATFGDRWLPQADAMVHAFNEASGSPPGSADWSDEDDFLMMAAFAFMILLLNQGYAPMAFLRAVYDGNLRDYLPDSLNLIQ